MTTTSSTAPRLLGDVGRFLRRPDQLDYLEEPDVFHDVFGHVPMLTDPVFADYLQAYGKGGQRASTMPSSRSRTISVLGGSFCIGRSAFMRGSPA